MAHRKVSVFKRGSRWGYMVRVDNKITKSGVADSKSEAERKAGGRAAPSKKKPRKKAKRSRKPARKAVRKPPRKAKKKAAKKKTAKKRTRISAAGCVVAKKGKTGGRTYKKVCGRKAPKSAAKAAEILSEYGHGVQEGRREKGCKPPKRGARKARGRDGDGGAAALRAAIRRDA